MNLHRSKNTYNIALYTIKNKGFDIGLELSDDKEEIIWWVAKKGEITVSAHPPLSLLTLVQLYLKRVQENRQFHQVICCLLGRPFRTSQSLLLMLSIMTFLLVALPGYFCVYKTGSG